MSTSKVYHNEFGIDATGFIKQFLNFNTGQFNIVYTPTYFITYRRHLNCGNIRFGVGGSFASQDIPVALPEDSNKYHSNAYTLDTRIGWEFTNELSKRWQVFYGLDFRPSYVYSKNDARFWSGGYANGTETKSQVMGIAPLIGFRFKLTSRLSLSTESSFAINVEKSSERRYFIPVTGQYPPTPDITTHTKKLSGGFNQPLSLMFTFDI